MRFICGISKDGKRRMFSAESLPTVEGLDDLTAELPCVAYGWGSEASLATCEITARLILMCCMSQAEAMALSWEYGEEVVRKMSTDKMWILPINEVEAWAKAHRLVM